MQPLTKSDLKELMMELRESMKASIREAVAAGFGNSKPALEQATATSQLLAMDASDAKVPAPACSSPDQGTSGPYLALTATIHIVPELDVDATGVAAPTPTTCLTDGLNHNADGDDHMAAWQAAWSTPMSFTVPPGDSPTPSREPALVLALHALAHAKCSTEGSEVIANSVVPASMCGVARSATVTTLYTAASTLHHWLQRVPPWPPDQWNFFWGKHGFLLSANNNLDAQMCPGPNESLCRVGKSKEVNLSCLFHWMSAWQWLVHWLLYGVELRPIPWPSFLIDVPSAVCCSSVANWDPQATNSIDDIHLWMFMEHPFLIVQVPDSGMASSFLFEKLYHIGDLAYSTWGQWYDLLRYCIRILHGTITVALALPRSCLATAAVHLFSYRLLTEGPCGLIAARASLCATLRNDERLLGADIPSQQHHNHTNPWNPSCWNGRRSLLLICAYVGRVCRLKWDICITVKFSTYLQLQLLVAIHTVSNSCHGHYLAWNWASSFSVVIVQDVDRGVFFNWGVTSLEYSWREFAIGAMHRPFPVTFTCTLCPAEGVLFTSYGHDQNICLESTGATYASVFPDQITSLYSAQNVCSGSVCDVLHSCSKHVPRNWTDKGAALLTWKTIGLTVEQQTEAARSCTGSLYVAIRQWLALWLEGRPGNQISYPCATTVTTQLFSCNPLQFSLSAMVTLQEYWCLLGIVHNLWFPLCPNWKHYLHARWWVLQACQAMSQGLVKKSSTWYWYREIGTEPKHKSVYHKVQQHSVPVIVRPGCIAFLWASSQKCWITPLRCSELHQWSSMLLACASWTWLVAWGIYGVELLFHRRHPPFQGGRIVTVLNTFVGHNYYSTSSPATAATAMATSATQVNDLLEASKTISTLPSMVELDIQKGTVRHPGSQTRNLLRVKRGIDMVKVLFEQILITEGNSLKDAASKAYAQVFAPHHGWAIRKAVGAGMYALPSKSQLLKKLNEDENSARAQMQSFVRSSGPVIIYVEDLFTSKNLGLDW